MKTLLEFLNKNKVISNPVINHSYKEINTREKFLKVLYNDLCGVLNPVAYEEIHATNHAAFENISNVVCIDEETREITIAYGHVYIFISSYFSNHTIKNDIIIKMYTIADSGYIRKFIPRINIGLENNNLNAKQSYKSGMAFNPAKCNETDVVKVFSMVYKFAIDKDKIVDLGEQLDNGKLSPSGSKKLTDFI